MPTTPNAVKGMIAVSDKRIKALGFLTWFSIPDESIGLRKLKATLATHGLPPSLAPKDTKAIHTFKRAVREQEGRTRNGVITETTVAQVYETPTECVYQVARLVRDLDERVIEYPKAMRVIFDKYAADIDFQPLGGVPRSEVIDMMTAIEDYFEKNSSKVTGARVRTVVRNFLKDEPDEQRGLEGLSGENLRGKAGGIYFVPAQHEEELTALSSALNELYPGRAYLHAIPMADGKSEREIIRSHHIANTREEMKEAIQEAKSLLSSDRDRAPRSDVVANKWSQFHALARRSSKYAQILEDEQDEIKDMADILKRQLDKLTG